MLGNWNFDDQKKKVAEQAAGLPAALAPAAKEPGVVGSILGGLSGGGAAVAANPWVGGALVAANLASSIFKAKSEKKKAMNKANVEGLKGAAAARTDAISNILAKLR